MYIYIYNCTHVYSSCNCLLFVAISISTSTSASTSISIPGSTSMPADTCTVPVYGHCYCSLLPDLLPMSRELPQNGGLPESIT